MKTKLERTLLDRSKQVAVIIPLLVGGAFIVVEAPSAWAAPSGYEFKLVSSLGAPAPGGGTFINDFEPGGSIIRATWPSELNSPPGAKESSSASRANRGVGTHERACARRRILRLCGLRAS